MKKSQLRKVSKKMSKALVKYRELKYDFLHPSQTCQVCLTRKATQIHHKKRRGKYLNDVSSWLPVCSQCHHTIESNPKWAMINGFTEDKFN